MSRTLLIVALSLAAIASEKVCAQTTAGDSLIVKLKNGQRVAIPIADIRKITFDTTTSSAVPATTPRQLEVSAYPNPLWNETVIEFIVPLSGKVTISITRLNGEHVRTLAIQNAIAGLNKVEWDGLDEKGLTVESGMYFLRTLYNGEVLTRRVMIVK